MQKADKFMSKKKSQPIQNLARRRLPARKSLEPTPHPQQPLAGAALTFPEEV